MQVLRGLTGSSTKPSIIHLTLFSHLDILDCPSNAITVRSSDPSTTKPERSVPGRGTQPPSIKESSPRSLDINPSGCHGGSKRSDIYEVSTAVFSLSSMLAAFKSLVASATPSFSAVASASALTSPPLTPASFKAGFLAWFRRPLEADGSGAAAAASSASFSSFSISFLAFSMFWKHISVRFQSSAPSVLPFVFENPGPSSRQPTSPSAFQ